MQANQGSEQRHRTNSTTDSLTPAFRNSETTEALNPTKQTPARNFCKEVAVQCSNSLGNGLLSVLRQALTEGFGFGASTLVLAGGSGLKV